MSILSELIKMERLLDHHTIK